MGVINWLNKLNKVLTNFWFAMVLAVVSMFAAFSNFLVDNTGWVIIDIGLSVYWWLIAWFHRKPAVTPETTVYKRGDKNITQGDIDTLTEIRDNMTQLITEYQTELDAKEKKNDQS